MKKKNIRPGDRFGKLTVIREEFHYPQKKRSFVCKCDCGSEVIKNITGLREYPYCQYCKYKSKKIESLHGEIWKDIKGYEGLYQISNKGRVKRLTVVTKFGKRLKIYPEQLKSTNSNKMGYPAVMLNKGGIKRFMTVHRLIAIAFIPNPNNKPEIDHINRNRADFRIENLRWVTHKENYNLNENTRKAQSDAQKKAIANGRKNIAYEKRRKRAVCQFDLAGNLLNTFNRIIDASHIARPDGICRACRDSYKERTAGGYVWKYKEDCNAD